MSEILFEIVFVLCLVLANGVFAMSEMSIVSSRRTRLQQRAEGGDVGARTALELADNPNRFLSTVQIGITLIGILAGAVGGAGLSEVLARQYALIPALEPYSGTLGLATVVAGIGYLSLVLGELAPKRIALGNAERIASLVSRPMRLLSRIAAPAVRLLSISTDAVVRLVGARKTSEPPITEQEVRILIRQGTEAGVFEESEQDMVENVFHLGDRTAASLMTPRPDVVFLDARDAKERLHEVLAAHRFSRYPLRGPESDDVVGIVRAKDVLLDVLQGDEVDLANLARPPLFVPETTSAMKTLEQMKASRVHCALVVDEFGVTVGMVTYHDVLEALVGDLPSADRPADALAVRRDDGSWLVDGALPVEEFIELLGLGSRGNQVRGPYHTMGGFVAARLGALPRVADRFTLEDLVVEVVDMDGNRVDKVLVTRAATQGTSPSASV
jgi:putative hemolysin